MRNIVRFRLVQLNYAAADTVKESNNVRTAMMLTIMTCFHIHKLIDNL